MTMSCFDVFQVPPARTTARRSTFGPGERVRHYGEDALVVGFSSARGVRLKSPAGGRPWYAEPEECEPVY
jgi:hypothetical protein